MSNRHVEIHDPFSTHNGINKSKDCDPKTTSDSDSMEDTMEFRLLMAYAKRRRPKKEPPTPDSAVVASGGTDANGSALPQTPANTEKEEKKKSKKKLLQRLQRFFKCIKPQTTDEDSYQDPSKQPDVDLRCGGIDDGEREKETDEFDEVASRLTEIADQIKFDPPEIEADSPEDENVEKLMGLLLRETGDKYNEEGLNNAELVNELFWNYSFFKKLITTLLTRLGLRSPDPESPGPKTSPKTLIAVTCEATTRLTAMNQLPSNLLRRHGAKYLQDYYSHWAQEHGGYENAFYSEGEDDDDDDDDDDDSQ